MGKQLKAVFVVIGAVVCSTLGIFAADTLQGIEGNLAQLVGSRSKSVCDTGTLPFKVGDLVTCIDQYEASPSQDCTHQEPRSVLQSEQNVGTAGCHAESKESAIPWTYISLTQAQRACAQAGKRLPSAAEWYRLALGTNSAACIINAQGVAKTGTEACISAAGAYDTIGNVWEWVDAQVTNNTYNDRILPESGHVSSVDADGIAITTSDDVDSLYDGDYFWSKQDGVSGMIRGGFYGSEADAGLYALNASVAMQFTAQGVGFRCVKDVF